MDKVVQLVKDVFEPEKREDALFHLSRRRQSIPDLAFILWQTPCIVAILLQEIIRVYPFLSPPTLSSRDSTRVCYSLCLFQCIAGEPTLRAKLLEANIPRYIYPLFDNTTNSMPFDHLRITSLGVIGAFIKDGADFDVILYLLQIEIVPLCLRIIDTGNLLSKTMATFIIEKILKTEVGLKYICSTPERFFAVGKMLAAMIVTCAQQEHRPSAQLIKHIIHCFHRFTCHPRANEGLKFVLPKALKDGTFDNLLQDEVATKKVLEEILLSANEECKNPNLFGFNNYAIEEFKEYKLFGDFGNTSEDYKLFGNSNASGEEFAEYKLFGNN